MRIKLAQNAGFCFGVKRAIHLALEAAKEKSGIVTLGPLIHNPQMVQKLNEYGIHEIHSASEIAGRTTIIRSHGIPRQDLQELKDSEVEIIDATCPYVFKTQQYAKQLSDEGYDIVILGNAEHPEVIALVSYIEGNVLVVADYKELPTEIVFAKVGVISQTTQNILRLQELVGELLQRSHEVRVINTICNATEVRQQSTMALAKISDVMIVIGGRNSSNTKMLARISEEFTETHLVETASEIDLTWFANSESVGITAGASTPDWLIIEVYNKIAESTGNDPLVRNVEEIPVYKEECNVIE